MATLIVLGGLVWMFLSGGGLNQLAVDPATGQPAAPGGYDLSGMWNAPAPQPAAPSTPQPANANYAPPVSVGGAAPPLGVGPTIRIASFNIEAFGDAKASRREVMYTLAEIIRKFHVVAIQEIRTTNAYHLPNFVKLINETGRHYDHVIGDRLGNTSQKEQYAFIFDADVVEVDRQSVYTVGDPDNLLHREPLVASFRTRGPQPTEAFTFILVNVHTDPNAVPAELEALAEAFRVVRRASRGEDDVIMLGDFNADDAHLGRLAEIPDVAPLVSRVASNTRENRLLDNIVIHKPSTTEYAGVSGVLNFRTELGLQLSLDQAEQISDHYPVWADFSVYERDYQGRIASRRGLAR
jgi:endonuclease/exonuclease/phosphatase family metal-dependent hydrolase